MGLFGGGKTSKKAHSVNLMVLLGHSGASIQQLLDAMTGEPLADLLAGQGIFRAVDTWVDKSDSLSLLHDYQLLPPAQGTIRFQAESYQTAFVSALVTSTPDVVANARIAFQKAEFALLALFPGAAIRVIPAS